MPRPRRNPLLVLLTDFGPQSPYVGALKLVAANYAPHLPVLDWAHDLPPQDLCAAALVLAGGEKLLPSGAVLAVIVDPGVGSQRRLLAAEFSDGLRVVLPDNGLLHALASRGRPVRLHALTEPRYWRPAVSAVFHGRDILTPVAAQLAMGLRLSALGPKVAPHTLAPSLWRDAHRLDDRALCGEVVYLDRFGNCVTNIRAKHLRPVEPRTIRCGRTCFPWATHYAAVAPGRKLALLGSYGFLELALRNGSAAQALKISLGAQVEIRFATP